MANCSNCNTPLDDSAKFCPNCGAAVVPAVIPSPLSSDPAPVSLDSVPVFEDSAPVFEDSSSSFEDPGTVLDAPAFEAPSPAAGESAPAFNDPPPAPEAPPPAFNPVPASESGFCPNCGELIGGATDCCEHCGAPLGVVTGRTEKKEGGPGLKKWIVLGGIGAVVIAAVIVLISIFSGGGKGYGLYIKDKELYYSNLSKNGAWQVSSKLYEDGDNREFSYGSYYITSRTSMSRDGKYLFFPDRLSMLGYGDFTLYCRATASGKKDAVKIDSGITRYAVSDNAALVTYLKNSNLYQYNMSRDEKEKLASDIRDFYVSDDGKKIIFLDDEYTLYQLDSGKEKVKLDSDAEIAAVSNDCKTILYAKNGDILYLKQDGKDKVKVASDVYDAFVYDTGEAYYMRRDGGDITLYFFDGKSSTELTDEYDDWIDYNYETPAMAYQDAGGEYWLASGGKTTKLDAEEPYNFGFSADGKSFWYITEPDRNDEGELYLISISNGAAKKSEKQDEDVYADYLRYTDGGHLIYFKDVSDNEGELYVDGKIVDDDVYMYSVSESESGALLYYVDYNSGKGYGTLKQYSGGKAAKVADDVSQACYMPNGSILYLADYSSSRYRGDLYVYSGGRSSPLDEDVVAIIPVTSEKYKG